MNIFARFIVLFMGVCGILKTSILRRKKRSQKIIRIPVVFIPQLSRTLIIKKELPPGRATRAVLHVLQDAVVQTELFNWIFDPSVLHHDTEMDFLIKNAEYEDCQLEKQLGNFNFRSFYKKLVVDPHSSVQIERQKAERKKRRKPGIMKSEGMLGRGTNPLYSQNKVNWDDGDIRPIPIIKIETLT